MSVGLGLAGHSKLEALPATMSERWQTLCNCGSLRLPCPRTRPIKRVSMPAASADIARAACARRLRRLWHRSDLHHGLDGR